MQGLCSHYCGGGAAGARGVGAQWAAATLAILLPSEHPSATYAAQTKHRGEVDRHPGGSGG